MKVHNKLSHPFYYTYFLKKCKYNNINLNLYPGYTFDITYLNVFPRNLLSIDVLSNLKIIYFNSIDK